MTVDGSKSSNLRGFPGKTDRSLLGFYLDRSEKNENWCPFSFYTWVQLGKNIEGWMYLHLLLYFFSKLFKLYKRLQRGLTRKRFVTGTGFEPEPGTDNRHRQLLSLKHQIPNRYILKGLNRVLNGCFVSSAYNTQHVNFLTILLNGLSPKEKTTLSEERSSLTRGRG